MGNEKNILEEITIWLENKENDSPVKRASFLEKINKHFYDFVKFNRNEGQGIDGLSSPEVRILISLIDATEDNSFAMRDYFVHGNKSVDVCPLPEQSKCRDPKPSDYTFNLVKKTPSEE